jgi:diguanylate cyclase (GGDEF)-like protein
MKIDYRHEFERRERGLKILRNLSEFIKILDLKEGDILKSMLVKFAIEATEADRGALLIYDPGRECLDYYAVYIYRDQRHQTEDYAERLKGISYRRGEGLIGRCLEDREVVVCQDTGREPLYLGKADGLLPVACRSVVYLPITVENELVALLEVANGPHSRALDETDLTIITNLTSAAMENAKLFLWAISDPLTRLFNIHYFRRTLASEVKRAERFSGRFTVVMIDIDDFKSVNDTYGHAQGDAVLVSLSNIFLDHLRTDVDIACRYGGDEFLLLLPNTPASGALVVMHRILGLVEQMHTETPDGKIFHCHVSIGLACYPEHGTDSVLVLKHADDALYAAKRTGKNRIMVYGETG